MWLLSATNGGKGLACFTFMWKLRAKAWFYACHDVSERAFLAPTTMTLIECERLYDGAGGEWIWEWIQKFASAKRKAMGIVFVFGRRSWS